MEVRINGDVTVLPPHTSVHQLLTQQGLLDQRIAIEINLEIVPRSAFETQAIQAGDQIEIVQAIGGG